MNMQLDKFLMRTLLAMKLFNEFMLALTLIFVFTAPTLIVMLFTWLIGESSIWTLFCWFVLVFICELLMLDIQKEYLEKCTMLNVALFKRVVK